MDQGSVSTVEKDEREFTKDAGAIFVMLASVKWTISESDASWFRVDFFSIVGQIWGPKNTHLFM